MTLAGISEYASSVSVRTIRGFSIVAIPLAAMFASVPTAHAQSSDTWKSVAIIGGSTAAGAIIGHKIGGAKGAYIGAAAGAAAGYAIDRHRRQNGYNDGYYGANGGDYPNDGYYGSNDPYYRNGGNCGNDGSYGAPYPNGDQGRYYTGRRR